MRAKKLYELTTGKEFSVMNAAVKFYGMPNLASILRSIKTGRPISTGPNAGLVFSHAQSKIEAPEHPTTRKQAIEQGAKHYFTGIPCKRGHVALRLTKGLCTECRKEDWATENAKRKLLPKSEASKAAGRRYYLRNKELVKARAMARPAAEVRKYRNKHRKNNPDIYKELVNARRRRLKDAQPSWATLEDKKRIRAFYASALSITEATGVLHEVDHIIPINSEHVCGLHVPWNLQVLTKEQNLRKSNKLASIDMSA